MKTMGLSTVAALALLGAGCGGSAADGPDAAMAVDGSFPDGPTREISGVVMDRFLAPDAVAMVPRDISRGFDVAAVVERATGEFTTHKGSGASDGRFVIGAVPAEGRAMVRVGNLYLDVEPDVVDLGALVGRRPDAVRVRLPTYLHLDLDGLVPWQREHRIELVFPWIDGRLELPSSYAPRPGDEELSALFNYPAITRSVLDRDAHLIDGSRGDAMFVTQLVPRELAGSLGTYHTIAAVHSPAPFTMVEEGTTRLRGDFSTVSNDRSISVDWRASAFEGEFADALLPPGSEASFTGRELIVHARPSRADSGASTASWGTLLALDLTGIGDAELALGYGNPFPAAWDVVATVSALAGRRYSTEGGTSVFLAAEYRVSMLLDELTAVPVEPLIGPVKNARLDGKDVRSAQAGFSTAPLLAWDAPDVGEPSYYEVEIYELEGNGKHHVATIRTTSTELRIPSGIMRPAERYVLRILSHWSPSDPIWGPWGTYYPHAVAGMLTEVMQR